MMYVRLSFIQRLFSWTRDYIGNIIILGVNVFGVDTPIVNWLVMCIRNELNVVQSSIVCNNADLLSVMLSMTG